MEENAPGPLAVAVDDAEADIVRSRSFADASWEEQLASGIKLPLSLSVPPGDVEGCDSSFTEDSSELAKVLQLAKALEAKHDLTLRLLAERLNIHMPTPKTSTSTPSTTATTGGDNRATSKSASTVEDLVQQSRRKAIWRFLEDRSSSRYAGVYAAMVGLLIAVGVFNYWSEFLDMAPFNPELAMTVQVFFASEWVLRFTVCPKRAMFLCDVYNWVDLGTTLVTLPVIFTTFGNQAVVVDTQYLKVFCPVLMLLKLLRRFRAFHLLLTAFKDALEALPLLMYTLFVIGSFFTALIFIVEPRSNVTSLGHAAWLVIVTMSTVGYGDVSATTRGGYLASAVMIIIASLYMALPIGLIGSSFSSVWADRKNLMMMQHIRDYIRWAGLSIEDVQRVLEAMDENGDKELSFDEFKELLPLLEVKLEENAALRLFQCFDKQEKGIIDYNTFLTAVFPGQHIFTAFSRRQLLTRGRTAML